MARILGKFWAVTGDENENEFCLDINEQEQKEANGEIKRKCSLILKLFSKDGTRKSEKNKKMISSNLKPLRKKKEKKVSLFWLRKFNHFKNNKCWPLESSFHKGNSSYIVFLRRLSEIKKELRKQRTRDAASNHLLCLNRKIRKKQSEIIMRHKS